MIFNHSRWQIWAANQHPYRHGLSEFLYSNPAFGSGVINAKQALDYVSAALYPQALPAVDNPAALPLLGNNIGDYRVVNDDGDGKAASYKWLQYEGEATPSWHKIADLDWGADSILQAWEQRTQDNWVMRKGYDEIDSSGAAVVGLYSGQNIFGGRSAGTNLTLWAGAGDGSGARTGFIQVARHFRPDIDDSWDLGDGTHQFQDLFLAGSAFIDTMTIAGGTISDTSNAIDFTDNDLTTTGAITGGSLKTGTMTITGGNIADTSGTVSFNALDLMTTGDLTANTLTATGAASSLATGTTIGNLTLGSGSITDSSHAISFGDNALTTTGAISAISATIGTQTFLAGTHSTTAGDLILNSFTGTVQVSAATLAAAAITATTVTTGTTAMSTGDITSGAALNITATTLTLTGTLFTPAADNAADLGDATHRFQDLFLSGTISDGTTAISQATIQSLRNINAGVADGMVPFWDAGTSTWLPSLPDTEITHDTLSGLTTGDAGHTQFALLAGRGAGQSLYGGTGAGDNLQLFSTSHGVKGFLVTDSVIKPLTDGVTDFGTSGNKWKDLYLIGQMYGARLQNATTGSPPTPGAGTKGQLYFATDTNEVFVDTGGTWKKVATDNYYLQDAANWGVATTTVTYDVSASMPDARKALWQFKDNANNFQVMIGADITSADASHVTVTFGVAPGAGTYTLVGIG